LLLQVALLLDSWKSKDKAHRPAWIISHTNNPGFSFTYFIKSFPDNKNGRKQFLLGSFKEGAGALIF
jgi:hypothetical protein